MSSWNVREKNGSWKGGRIIGSNGYIQIRMPNHPNAHKTGYIYEHRVVAEKKIGRILKCNESVHHIDGNKENNSPENLMVLLSNAHHHALHRTEESRLQDPDEPNIEIECACGCREGGKTASRFNSRRI